MRFLTRAQGSEIGRRCDSELASGLGFSSTPQETGITKKSRNWEGNIYPPSSVEISKEDDELTQRRWIEYGID